MNWKLIGIALLLFYGWRYASQPTPPSYNRELQTLQEQVIDPDHQKNDTQLGRDIIAGRKNDPKKKIFSIEDIQRDRLAVMPSAERAAQIDLIAKEWEATAQGKLLPIKTTWLPGSQSTWLYTDIPVYSCMHITATGMITRGVYGKAGPDGIDLDAMMPEEREGFLSLNGDKKTLMPGVRWGTPLGRTCTDAEGLDCGPPFPLGQSRYLSPTQIRGGYLWVIPNGFVSGDTGAGILSGIKQVNRSDYNVYQGGFRIDRQKAPDYLCELDTSHTLVAQR